MASTVNTHLSRPCSGIAPLLPTPVYKLAHINEFHEKASKTGENYPISTCQVSCTKANRQLSATMLNGRFLYQGKTDFY